MRLFITGTDTDVGKTHVTALLLGALKARGESAAGFKPISCGGREDAVILAAASNPPLALDEVNPVALRCAASPMAAALIENHPVDVPRLLAAYEALAARYTHVLVEGAGGWEVPIRRNFTMADLAAAMGAPVAVVVRNRLGALNHTILTVRNLVNRGLACAGIILNHVDDARDSASITHRAILEDVLGVPVVLDILHGETTIEWPFGGG